MDICLANTTFVEEKILDLPFPPHKVILGPAMDRYATYFMDRFTPIQLFIWAVLLILTFVLLIDMYLNTDPSPAQSVIQEMVDFLDELEQLRQDRQHLETGHGQGHLGRTFSPYEMKKHQLHIHMLSNKYKMVMYQMLLGRSSSPSSLSYN